MRKIEGFFSEFRFLSNFEPVKVLLDGLEYPSTEHAYQAAKTLVPEEREKIRLAKTANLAKRFGRKVTMRPNWEEIKEDVMRDVLIQKFAQEPYRTLLLATEDAYLEETNYWNDRYWGVSGNMGLNRLGHLLMGVRADLQNLGD